MSVKNVLWFACLLLMGCASARTSVKITDPAIIRSRPQPVKIFSIGYYEKSHMVLILIDGSGQYLTVITPRNDGLKKGDTYVVIE